jgi:hypothetical protein
MQGFVDPPRNGLTAATVMRLIRDEPGITIGKGCELLDRSLTVLEDISTDLAGGSVSRSAYATLHGTCRLGISRELDWGTALVRPFMTISDGVTSARFNLGVYRTSRPKRRLAETPPTHEVIGYDILKRLDTTVGETYSLAAGAAYLTEVAAILAVLGYSGVLIDQQAAAKVLPGPRSWPIDNTTTWLNIVNDLLAAVGYQGLWSDWDGRLRSGPYSSPLERTVEWTYDVGTYTAMMEPDGEVEQDWFDAYNRWVSIRSNNVDGPAPVEGDGVYTFVNQFTGPTSVAARDGEVNSRVEYFDAADQASLIAQAQQMIDADMRVKTVLRNATSPNPMHWHFDRLTVDDPKMGPVGPALSTQWTLPLNGDPMTHEWTLLG